MALGTIIPSHRSNMMIMLNTNFLSACMIEVSCVDIGFILEDLDFSNMVI